MPPSAHTALVISIVASALGALVMCLLVARYGLTPAAGDDAARSLIVTRFGHAVAGVCFAATGILALVALVVPTRQPRAEPQTVVNVQPDRGAEARLQALAAELKTLASRLDQAETRMTAVDSASRRLGDEVGSITARAKQMEKTIAALPRRLATPEPAKDARQPVTPRELVREPPRASERPSPPPATVDVPPPAPPLHTPEPVVAPRPRGPEPVSHRSQPTAARSAEPAASPRATAPSGRATIEAPRNAEGSAAAAKPNDGALGDKLRDDWKTIRGGFTTAGDEFKAAVKDLGRKIWR